ncbi:MAG: TrmH family RNA methyltransferase [Pauljensenia sp.]
MRRVAGLAGRSARSRSGLMLVDGPQAVRELVTHRGEHVRDVYLSGHAAQQHPDILEAARASTRWVHEVTDEVARAMSPDAQGVIAVARSEAVGDGTPRAGGGPVVVLARAQDPGNAGTIIRTADAMGASRVVLTRDSVDVRNPKVLRASAGSVFHLPVATGVELGSLVEDVHEGGSVVMGTSGADGSLELSDLLAEAMRLGEGALTVSHAWVLGNEAQGLSPLEEDACDVLVRIPMTGQAESLNVSSAAAMCLFASQCGTIARRS